MRKQKDEPIDMLQGTLDLLVLRALLFGPIHGHAIAKSIERTSQDVLPLPGCSAFTRQR
jgi:DNA-binding PadR family transcriptional regulator